MDNTHRQDCICDECIIGPNFNPKRTHFGRIHRQDCVCTKCIEINVKEISRTMNNNHKKRDEDTDIKFETGNVFYKEVAEEWDGYLSTLRRKEQQLKNLTIDIQDLMKDYQKAQEIRKDIKKLKNKMKELQDCNNIDIRNEVGEQAKQTKRKEQIRKQREQIKKFKED